MNLLVLGGTAFLGRCVAAEAVTRGHTVTCAARGTAPCPPGAQFVTVDRDLHDGLAPLRSHHWDAIVDVARQPGHVRQAVRHLTTRHWVFVSSINVYASFAEPGQDETAALCAPLQAEAMDSMDDYGPAKVACEEAVASAGTTATIARAGLIGGPGDLTGRSGYWPWRFAHPAGRRVVVPDDPDLPVSMVDVRDIAAWLVDSAEDGRDGVFNVNGPITTLGAALDAASQVAGGGVERCPVAAHRLRELGVQSWMGPKSLPLWLDDPEYRGFAAFDATRAVEAGLRTRDLRETFADTLLFEESRTTPRQAGLDDEDEILVLEAVGAA